MNFELTRSTPCYLSSREMPTIRNGYLHLRGRIVNLALIGRDGRSDKVLQIITLWCGRAAACRLFFGRSRRNLRPADRYGFYDAVGAKLAVPGSQGKDCLLYLFGEVQRSRPGSQKRFKGGLIMSLLCESIDRVFQTRNVHVYLSIWLYFA